MSWIKYIHYKASKRAQGLEEEKGDKEGYVYIFSLGHDNLYKIGCTKNVLKRLKDLQAGNPKMKCVWSARVADMHSLEKRLHKMFHQKKVEREIFTLRPGDIKQVNNFVISL